MISPMARARTELIRMNFFIWILNNVCVLFVRLFSFQMVWRRFGLKQARGIGA